MSDTRTPERKRLMEPASAFNAQQAIPCPFDELDSNILSSILKWLSPEEVATASLTCKLLHGAAEAAVVWRHLYDTLLCSRVKERLLPPPEQIADWRGAVIRGRMLTKLQYGMWERINCGDREAGAWARPCAREGHAAAAWGRDSMILFGGWGSGIRNDIFILERVYDNDDGQGGADAAQPGPATAAAGAGNGDGAASSIRRKEGPALWILEPANGGVPAGPSLSPEPGPEPSSSSSSAARTQQGGSAAPWLGPAERPCSWRWRVPRVAGRRPSIRYGHSVTRCGASGELLAVYGGMQAGGYTAEISSLAILRPYSGTPTPGCEAPAAAAAGSSSGAGGHYDFEYEWHHPALSGPDPGARGYHAACASEDGRRLFVFAGIAGRDSIARLTVIDLANWTVERPTTTGPAPCPRFGCSMVAYGNRLWVVGGGNGSDLARSGVDMHDAFTLDLATLEWNREETVNRPPDERALGRCHASALVGSKLVLFGGSLELGNDVTWLDLDCRTWGRPAALQGRRPGKRMSAVMALSGSDLILFGGWIYSSGEMGDLSRLRLLLTDPELRLAKQELQAAAAGSAAVAIASAAAAPAAGPSGTAASASAAPATSSRPQDAIEELSEQLNAKIARYYALMRAAQEREDGGGHVPTALVQEMHETMTAIRLLRMHVRRREEELEDEQEEEAGVEEDPEEVDGQVGWFFYPGSQDSGDGEEGQEDEEEAEGESCGAEGAVGGAGGAAGGAGRGAPGWGPRETGSEETGEEETDDEG